jgi:hypothetical protein
MFDDGSVTDRHFYYPFVGAPLACPANDRRSSPGHFEGQPRHCFPA